MKNEKIQNRNKKLLVETHTGNFIEHTFRVHFHFGDEEKDSDGHVAHDGQGMDGASCTHCVNKVEKIEMFYHSTLGELPSATASSKEILQLRSTALSL